MESSKDADSGQVSDSAAEIYDRFFVPALFGAWARPLCRAVDLQAGQRVLDLACGTGATTRAALAAVGPGGAVTGLDRNAGMLEVARARAPTIDWVEGRAETLPFPDAAFDAAICQFGLMFFEDRPAALREMTRVVRPGGGLALTVWDRVETSPGYARMIALLGRLFGARVAKALLAPYLLGDLADLRALQAQVGWQDARIETQDRQARFPSIRDWVTLDVRGWTLSDMIDEAQFALLVESAERELADLAGPDGAVVFPAPAHIVSRTRPLD
ncbi:MAG: methyltransferase domain-containing protein [Rhodospirillales bacterium]